MIRNTLSLTAFLIFGFTYSITAFADDSEGTSKEIAFCPAALSESVCKSYLSALKEAALTNPDNKEAFRQALSDAVDKQIREPEFWNGVLESPAMSNAVGVLPLTLNFKLFDRENADSVIGLEFSYSRDFNKTIFSDKGPRELSYQFNFNVEGVVTQNAEENPRNFVNAKFAFSGSSTPSFNLKKTVEALSSEHCYETEYIDDPQCAKWQAIDLEKFFEPVGSAFYIDYGLDIGFETDQEFDAKNQTYGLFTFIAYEDFHRDTFMGINNIKPSIRLAVESVEPNSETSRAMAGDDSSYARISGEFSLVIPLTKLAGVPYSFGFSYRAYDELDASDVVKVANLDSYRLRTYSLASPTGLFVSYSSGRLPFGIDDENVVELGYKTYF